MRFPCEAWRGKQHVHLLCYQARSLHRAQAACMCAPGRFELHDFVHTVHCVSVTGSHAVIRCTTTGPPSVLNCFSLGRLFRQRKQHQHRSSYSSLRSNGSKKLISRLDYLGGAPPSPTPLLRWPNTPMFLHQSLHARFSVDNSLSQPMISRPRVLLRLLGPHSYIACKWIILLVCLYSCLLWLPQYMYVKKGLQSLIPLRVACLSH